MNNCNIRSMRGACLKGPKTRHKCNESKEGIHSHKCKHCNNIFSIE